MFIICQTLFLYINSFNPQTNGIRWVLILFLFYRQVNFIERLRNMLKIVQLLSSGNEIHTHKCDSGSLLLNMIDGWIDGWMDGWMEGWMDGWWMDG